MNYLIFKKSQIRIMKGRCAINVEFIIIALLIYGTGETCEKGIIEIDCLPLIRRLVSDPGLL